MGTSSLMMVKKDNEYKVTENGYYDGRPSLVGADIYDFLKYLSYEKEEKEKLINNLEYCSFKQYFDKNDILLEEMGYIELLKEILNNDSCKRLIITDSRHHVLDSSYCEWAYIIDFDTNKFEIYKGMNEKPLTKNERFYYYQNTDEFLAYKKQKEAQEQTVFYPCSLFLGFSLDELPNSKEHFIKEINLRYKL